MNKVGLSIIMQKRQKMLKYFRYLFGKRVIYSDYMKMMSTFTLIRNFSEAFFTYK